MAEPPVPTTLFGRSLLRAERTLRVFVTAQVGACCRVNEPDAHGVDTVVVAGGQAILASDPASPGEVPTRARSANRIRTHGRSVMDGADHSRAGRCSHAVRAERQRLSTARQLGVRGFTR
jgi:hypothetical protein